MNLTAQLTSLRQQTDGLSPAEQAALCCEVAKQLEKVGEYHAAAEAMAEFWPDQSEDPRIENLDAATQATVLLRVGNLTGFLGSADQAAGRQERAKDLITRSVELFEMSGDNVRAAEARGDLALCYWREGAYDEARINLRDALGRIGEARADVKAVLLIRAAMVEVWTRRLQNGLTFLNAAEPLVNSTEDHSLKGSPWCPAM